MNRLRDVGSSVLPASLDTMWSTPETSVPLVSLHTGPAGAVTPANVSLGQSAYVPPIDPADKGGER